MNNISSSTTISIAHYSTEHNPIHILSWLKNGTLIVQPIMHINCFIIWLLLDICTTSPLTRLCADENVNFNALSVTPALRSQVIVYHASANISKHPWQLFLKEVTLHTRFKHPSNLMIVSGHIFNSLSTNLMIVSRQSVYPPHDSIWTYFQQSVYQPHNSI